MTFSETLNAYLDEHGITAAALSRETGISKATVSRLKNGLREPSAGSDTVVRLAAGIAALSNGTEVEDAVAASLAESIAEEPYDFDCIASNLNHLIEELEVNVSDLSRFLKFDPSYLSRIRSGSRRPARPRDFCEGVAAFVASQVTERNAAALARLVDCTPEQAASPATCRAFVIRWLMTGAEKQESAVEHFFQRLDEFDLREFTESIDFDSFRIPTVPFQLPKARDLYDVSGLMEAEIGWLRATVTSKSQEPVFMYTDLPIEEMAEDQEFAKKWMMGLALLAKKGLPIKMLHDVDRPIAEMMLGLESWIPLYMTGLVSPYYLKGYSVTYFHTLLQVSGAAAVGGQEIAGCRGQGRYRFTNNREELAYYRRRSDNLLAKASPLMEVFTERDEQAYESSLAEMLKGGAELEPLPVEGFKNIEMASVDGKCVVITKMQEPKIRFVIRHPKLRRAIEALARPFAE